MDPFSTYFEIPWNLAMDWEERLKKLKHLTAQDHGNMELLEEQDRKSLK